MKQYWKRILALTLTVIVLSAGCLGVSSLMQANVLRPVAARLGTSPTKAALANYGDVVLQKQIGATRSEVHEALHTVGDVDFPEHLVSHRADGTIIESVYWQLAESPLTGKLWLTWTLTYDSSKRLIDFEPGSS